MQSFYGIINIVVGHTAQLPLVALGVESPTEGPWCPSACATPGGTGALSHSWHLGGRGAEVENTASRLEALEAYSR